MLKHTPGPWRRAGNLIWGSTIQRLVARINSHPGEILEDNGNAVLIKNSPQLYKAICLAETYLEDGAPISALRVIKTALKELE